MMAVHPLLERQRDRGGEDEDEHERALELAQKQTKRAQARGVFNAVGADRVAARRRARTKARLGPTPTLRLARQRPGSNRVYQGPGLVIRYSELLPRSDAVPISQKSE